MLLITYSINELNMIEYNCVKSWIDNGYTVDLYTYSKKNDLKVNIKNAEKYIRYEELEKIEDPIYRKFFFKIKLAYIIGGLVLDPDIYCNKFYNFNEKTFVSYSPTINYLESYPDFCILKFPKKSKELHYMVNHFFMLYNDFIKGYNTKYRIDDILIKLIDKMFKLSKLDWKNFHSCNVEHWRTQLGLPINIEKNKSFEGGIKGFITNEKKLGYFTKLWQEKFFLVEELGLSNCKDSLLLNLMREKTFK